MLPGSGDWTSWNTKGNNSCHPDESTIPAASSAVVSQTCGEDMKSINPTLALCMLTNLFNLILYITSRLISMCPYVLPQYMLLPDFDNQQAFTGLSPYWASHNRLPSQSTVMKPNVVLTIDVCMGIFQLYLKSSYVMPDIWKDRSLSGR